MGTTVKDNNNDKKQQQQHHHGTHTPYLAVKQKLRPAGSDKLQQQHKQQYEAVIDSTAAADSSSSVIGGYSFSSSSSGRRGKNSAAASARRGQKSFWKSTWNAMYSLLYNVLFYAMFLVIAFAIGYHIPTMRLVLPDNIVGSNNSNQETSLLVVYYASSAILLSLVFTQCQKTLQKSSNNNTTGTYRSLDPSDPTAEYINVRERLRKSSLTLKQQQQENNKSRSGAIMTRDSSQKPSTVTMRCFLLLYSCLSFTSLVATCAAIGFYCHDPKDDFYRIWTVTTAGALTLWFQQRLALIWQTAFGIGYYFYFNPYEISMSLSIADNPDLMQHAAMMGLTVGSRVLLTVVAEVVCGNFRQDDKSCMSKGLRGSPSIWSRFTRRPTAASSSRNAKVAVSTSALDYDDNPNDPYAQVRQSLRKSPTNHANPNTVVPAQTATTPPVYTDIRQKLQHVNVPTTDEIDSPTGPVVKAHAAPAKAKEASKDLGLEKTMQLLMQQKSRLDTIAGTTTTTTLTEAVADVQGVLKTSPVPSKGLEGSRDLKLEETMRICLEQKNLLKKLEEEEEQKSQKQSAIAKSEIVKTSPVAQKGLEGARDVKLEETMRICLEQKSRLKKHGEAK